MDAICIDADYKDISARLKEAGRRQMLDVGYNEALSQLRKQEWSRAREKLEEVLAAEPAYRDAERQL
jgi:Tfp pilus assembly protein PilF